MLDKLTSSEIIVKLNDVIVDEDRETIKLVKRILSNNYLEYLTLRLKISNIRNKNGYDNIDFYIELFDKYENDLDFFYNLGLTNSDTNLLYLIVEDYKKIRLKK